jgi:Pyridoxamine 5'-phosphate oxidase
VLLDGLREQTTQFGDAAYVITVTDDGKPHAVSVTVGWDDDLLTFGAGRTTLANAAERPDVALLWPPVEAGGYSLIVDGHASRRAGAAGDGLAVQPSRAVLHRPAATGPPRSDCVNVFKR